MGKSTWLSSIQLVKPSHRTAERTFGASNAFKNAMWVTDVDALVVPPAVGSCRQCLATFLTPRISHNILWVFTGNRNAGHYVKSHNYFSDASEVEEMWRPIIV